MSKKEDNPRQRPPRRMPDENPQVALERMVKQYMEDLAKADNRKRYTEQELEVRFGTRGIKPLTKVDYDNVIIKLRSLGFTCENQQGQYMMRMSSQTLDSKTGEFRPSNIRAEINGYQAIQDYCKNGNNIQDIYHNTTKYGAHSTPVQFVKKSNIYIDDKQIYPVNFDNFNFRVSYQTETKMDFRNPIVSDMMNKWQSLKKTFRYINRVTFVHNEYPIKVDISIVKSSSLGENRQFKSTYTTEESNVFENQEFYEIELEVDNKLIGVDPFNKVDIVLEKLKKVIKFVLMGLQETNYPCAYTEQTAVLQEYQAMINAAVEKEQKAPVRGKEERSREMRYPTFIGPSSYTLQIENIVPISENSRKPNIRKYFTVTDKADGERHLMFISASGKIYLINSNMKVIFTGARTNNEALGRVLLDGEIIKHNKEGAFINLYAAFDIYFVEGNDVRSYGFIPVTKGESLSKYRLPLLKNVIKVLRAKSVVPEEFISPIRVESKTFYPKDTVSGNIFEDCSYILGKQQNGLFEYNTDGLIFTPANMGVGTSSIGKPSPNTKVTWTHSFKWKPVEFNTVDFLVTTKKNETGSDLTTPVFTDGISAGEVSQVNEYKTIILRCGFDEKEHGYINPAQQLLDDNFPTMDKDSEGRSKNNYRPVQFYPTDPYDPMAGICNIMLKRDDTGINQMFSSENEAFLDETIVEFSYDVTKERGWRWTPLRVRYDKTTQLKQTGRNFGNAYHVANSNWHSIHYPVTVEMISTGSNIPDIMETEENDDVYYNTQPGERNESKTLGLRHFHNLFVKNKLILGVSRKGDTLIDYACGKGGDFPKWIAGNLSFVFGIDISKDNLENRLDGACARFLNYHKKYKSMPYALFVHGTSASNIRTGMAMMNDKAKAITRSVFGQGPKEAEDLGPAVARQYGKGEDGFQISSCQFALHYFFENQQTFHGFMRNISECTKLGGYFIGASYDGKLIFNMLKNKQMGESETLYDGSTKIWEVQKEYDGVTMLEDDSSSLGCQINVYQESINKMFPEYLVNYDYLDRVMENYGFKLISRDEAKNMGLPGGTGLFSELFQAMMAEGKKTDYKDAINMTSYEKKISFLNRYFVYKKISNVNAEKIANELMSEDVNKPRRPSLPKKTSTSSSSYRKKVTLTKVEEKPRAKKLNRVLILQGDFADEEKEEAKEEEKEEDKQTALEKEAPIAEAPIAEAGEGEKEPVPIIVNPSEQQEKEIVEEETIMIKKKPRKLKSQTSKIIFEE